MFKQVLHSGKLSTYGGITAIVSIGISTTATIFQIFTLRHNPTYLGQFDYFDIVARFVGSLADHMLLPSVILFIGAKLLEAKTLITIGYDRIDAGRMLVKQPGDDFVVWIGRRYDSHQEAQAVADLLAQRIDTDRDDSPTT